MPALSPDAPTRPIEPTIAWLLRARANFLLRTWDLVAPWAFLGHPEGSRSVCTMQPDTSPRRATAWFSGGTPSRNFIRESLE